MNPAIMLETARNLHPMEKGKVMSSQKGRERAGERTTPMIKERARAMGQPTHGTPINRSNPRDRGRANGEMKRDSRKGERVPI